MKTLAAKVPMPVWYVLVGIGAIFSYAPARANMLHQDAWIIAVQSNITVNFILLFFMWGLLSDRLTKHMPKKKGWLVWGIGLILMVLFFKFVGGFETRWF